MTHHPEHGTGLQDNSDLLHRINARLADRFAGVFAAETVERYIAVQAMSPSSKLVGNDPPAAILTTMEWFPVRRARGPAVIRSGTA